ncbi:MAG: hypothetical protein J7545_12090 [Roseofilum sp. SBFL]|uniref:hypothetical protein n=2 Tax=Roseofilum TaxID=1233426 RepID=UPI001B1FFF70|nr:MULTISPECIES: hypothetical protein [unclassified Roseofilum]MBP0022656.1 hypothetical protein [Roseofilum sp. SID2]MBP0042702.1 hypothetical protein [Roseofilum sp. SBFL]
MNSRERGAEVQATSPRPSIDLVTLVELLTRVISPSNDRENPSSDHFNDRAALIFDAQNQRLRLCTSAILLRLFNHPQFKKSFNPQHGGGFIKDLTDVRYGTRAYLGGHLTEGNNSRLRDVLVKLIEEIDRSIDAALPEDRNLSSLLLDQPEEKLRTLSKNIGTSFKNDRPHTATLIPLGFESIEDRPNSVPHARVISAIERVQTGACWERMLQAVGEYLEQQDTDEDDINVALQSLQAEKQGENSQVQGFLDFLEDKALARVRLKITFRIMEAIASTISNSTNSNKRNLSEYIHRVLELFESAQNRGYSVDLTVHFGSDAEFNLEEELRKAIFYSCLPVWPEAKAQIFEQKVDKNIVREVSYRFRVNGQNPDAGKSAFAARLDKIKDALLNEDKNSPTPAHIIRFRLAELIFLAVVLPGENKTSVNESMAQILNKLKSQGKEFIQELLKKLLSQDKSISELAEILIGILRQKRSQIIHQVKRNLDQQFICVKQDIINWDRLEVAESGAANLFANEKDWFKQIEICDRPETPNLLFSVKVNTQLSEYNLVAQGESNSIQAQRLFTPKILQVRWVPYDGKKENGNWVYRQSDSTRNAQELSMPALIQVEYDIKYLTRTPKKQTQQDQSQQPLEKSKQYHAGAIAGFSVLIYTYLWRIIRRIKEIDPSEFTVLMLRLQESGRQRNDENKRSQNGEYYVYGAAQAIESALAEDIPIRMQGMVLKNANQDQKNSKKMGSFQALISAFPVAISTPTVDNVPNIGLISYATRPCDDVGNFDKSELLLSQSYYATKINQPFEGYKLQHARMKSDIIDLNSGGVSYTQRLVQEEINNLKDKGCKHIILLSHAYRGRRINRAADYNLSLNPVRFLESLFESFPNLTIYPMVRDIFPATRLHKREPNEAAFEILRAGHHGTFSRLGEEVRGREIIPVYTFATLYAIQPEKRPQSGFCVYFLVSDQRVSNIDWTERARQHLINPEGRSPIHPGLMSMLRGLHFIEAERGVQKGQLMPVLDPFSWISPTTTETAGEVEILHSRRKGKVFLSYRALLSRVSSVLHSPHFA